MLRINTTTLVVCCLTAALANGCGSKSDTDTSTNTGDDAADAAADAAVNNDGKGGDADDAPADDAPADDASEKDAAADDTPADDAPADDGGASPDDGGAEPVGDASVVDPRSPDGGNVTPIDAGAGADPGCKVPADCGKDQVCCASGVGPATSLMCVAQDGCGGRNDLLVCNVNADCAMLKGTKCKGPQGGNLPIGTKVCR
ncbi:MAG: hypothetical protein RJA70_4386 [Pseudomonadota bacterium]|jgi:hypothetical protein